MPAYRPNVERFYREFWYSGSGKAGPFIDEHDARKSFENEYLRMNARFKKQNKILSVTLPDALSGLFSDDVQDRDSMVEHWCSLKNDSHEKNASTDTKTITSDRDKETTIFDVDSEYPIKFTKKGGPVPIQIASGPNTYDRTGPSDPSRGTGYTFTWTDQQYRNVLLGLRAVKAPALYHLKGSSKRHVHASIKGRPGKTCGELLPFINFGKGGYPWDENEFGCRDCDAHTLIFTFIALAEKGMDNDRWSLSIDTSVKSITTYISVLNNRRYKYEDIWRLIAQYQNQPHGCVDEANAWGMAKLKYLDEDKESQRRYHWSEKKAREIRNQMVLFNKNREERIIKQKSNGQKSIPARRTVKPKAQARIEVVESDSDDDIVTLWDSQESQQSTPILTSSQGTSAGGRAKKRQIVHVDSDSGESENDAFKKFKKTMEGFRR